MNAAKSGKFNDIVYNLDKIIDEDVKSGCKSRAWIISTNIIYYAALNRNSDIINLYYNKYAGYASQKLHSARIVLISGASNNNNDMFELGYNMMLKDHKSNVVSTLQKSVGIATRNGHVDMARLCHERAVKIAQ